MSKLRNRAVRKKLTPSNPGTTDTEKLQIIRALYIAVYNREESLLPYAVEFFHVLGSILEGTHAEDLTLQLVDKKTLLSAIDDLARKD